MDFDIGERLFGRFWKRGRAAKADRAAGRAWFAERTARSEAFASMWAGSRVAVREAECLGGVRETAVLMPRLELLPGETDEQRELFWSARLVHAAEMVRERKTAWEKLDQGRGMLEGIAAAWRPAVRHLLLARSAEQRLRAQSSEWSNRADLARSWQAEGPVTFESRRSNGALDAWRTLRMAFFRGDLSSEQLIARAKQLPPSGAAFIDPGLPLWGGALRAAEVRLADLAAQEERDSATAEAGVEEGASELAARPRDFVQRTALEDDADKDIMPEHVFEKIETLEEHVGGRRRPDGEDELDDHADALDELDLRDLVRGGPEAESVYQLELDAWDVVPEVGDLLPGEKGIPYDEWDPVRSSYRRDWVTVYPTAAPAPLPGWAQPIRTAQRTELRRLVRNVDQRRERREYQRRVLEGAEVDLEEYVVEQASMQAGRPGSGRVYRQRRPRQREFACSVLLDISLSSDSWVQDQRVLDASRAATVLIGDLAEELGDAFRLQCFASQTRHHNRVWTLKDWDQPWSREVDRLGSLRCQGYTRIGAALRHATAGLATHPARRRLLLILTDGKPTDYDRYEGRYGRGDIRQAAREAGQQGVRLHAIGFDPRVARHLGPMFGPGCWNAVDGPASLVAGVAEAYQRFTS